MNLLRKARETRAAFGPRARALRLAAGLSQRELARLAIMSRKYVQQIEYGKANPTVETVALLAYALGCDLADLMPTIRK